MEGPLSGVQGANLTKQKMFALSKRIQSQAKKTGYFDPLADFLIGYIESGDESMLSSNSVSFGGIDTLCNETIFGTYGFTWTDGETRLVKAVLHRAKYNFADPSRTKNTFGHNILIAAGRAKYHREALGRERSFDEFYQQLKEAGFNETHIQGYLVPAENRLPWKDWFDSRSDEDTDWKTGFERHIWSLDDDSIFSLASELGSGQKPLVIALSKYRPETLRGWLVRWRAATGPRVARSRNILHDLLRASDAFDVEIVGIMKAEGDHASLKLLDDLRPGKFVEKNRNLVANVPFVRSFEEIARQQPSDVIDELNELIAEGNLSEIRRFARRLPVLEICAKNLLVGGQRIYDKLLSTDYNELAGAIVGNLACHAPEEASDYVNEYCKQFFKLATRERHTWMWYELKGTPRFLVSQIENLKNSLREKKSICGHASDALRAVLQDGYFDYCNSLLHSPEKSDQTHGLALLGEAGSLSGETSRKAKETLQGALSSPWPKAFHERILKKFEQLDVDVISHHNTIPLAKPMDLDSVIPAKQRRPIVKWMDLADLPLLKRKDGSTMSEATGWYLIEEQRSFKEIGVAPGTFEVLNLLDPPGNSAFAMCVLNHYLASEQKAADRWALAVAGLLGDARMIPPLLSRINDWCENSRHKLAEYAAQAISLLPGNEPLMVLDTLSNRYRSKFKNVGKACAEAFNAAATARGITTDELGDLVVPDFGFDAEGIRRFNWVGGGASAELGADFKLTWFDPETDKAWKALPAGAPEEIKTEVKTLTKLLREAVKGQIARLEMTLVGQRRWPVARWRELFENHPLLRSFASSLVWGVYDSTGKLLRTFRRYPNGLLADAVGGLEELPEADTMIGMVHPLDLTATPTQGRDGSPQPSGEWKVMEKPHESPTDPPMGNPSPLIHTDRPEVGPCQSTPSLDAWRAHLTRFKVKAPFPQIDRPVELLDPLHGNRRSITLTEKKSVSAGTFRSRAEKRGWTRGSVVDAGGISSYYKLYPGAGVEVILPTDNFWVGCDPMDTVELSAAYFVKAESVERGSYIYNEPGPDDPRVLRFDEVPTVVYSETISDLKAIVATKE